MAARRSAGDASIHGRHLVHPLSPDGARRATGLAMLTATAFFFGGAMVAGKVAVAEVPPVHRRGGAVRDRGAILLFALRLAWPALNRGSSRPRRPRPADHRGAGIERRAPATTSSSSTACGWPRHRCLDDHPRPGADREHRPRGRRPARPADPHCRHRPGDCGIIGVLLVVDPSGSIGANRLPATLFVGCAVLFGSYFLISRVAGAGSARSASASTARSARRSSSCRWPWPRAGSQAARGRPSTRGSRSASSPCWRRSPPSSSSTRACAGWACRAQPRSR